MYACVGSSDFLPSIEKQNSFVFNENLTWIHGRHSLKFGTEIRKEQFTIFQISAPRGDMGFGPDFTDNPALPFNSDGSQPEGTISPRSCWVFPTAPICPVYVMSTITGTPSHSSGKTISR